MAKHDPALEKGLATITIGVVAVSILLTLFTGSLGHWIPVALGIFTGFQVARMAK